MLETSALTSYHDYLTFINLFVQNFHEPKKTGEIQPSVSYI